MGLYIYIYIYIYVCVCVYVGWLVVSLADWLVKKER